MACSLLQDFFSSTLFHYNKINKSTKQFVKGSSQEISVNVVYLISNHLQSENYTTNSLTFKLNSAYSYCYNILNQAGKVMC